MKMKLNKSWAIAAVAALAFSSCAVHDPFADNMEIGQMLPTVDWEQNSVLVKAGNYATFKAKYYTTGEAAVDHSEVWALVKRSQTAEATSKLTSSLAYTKSIGTTDTVRSLQQMDSFDHSKAEWDGHEYVLTDSFPTSRTLAPLAWNTPADWDNEKFTQYYPATFKQEFVDHMVTYLTRDSAYYNDLRNIYIKYDFTAEQFQALNAKYGVDFPTVTESDQKSDAWFTTTEVDHYYYEAVENGVTVVKEIATLDDIPAGVDPTKVFEVYKSSPWLMCRYSDDVGGKLTYVRREYMPYWKELISSIPFEQWIYNSADKTYTVNFTRSYSIIPEFRVYDTNGKYGRTTDNKEVTLN
ncbi:MAG: hypothetical protein IJT30_03950 [Muribaculaceae bacterium]|nr:hypothetical protein [Muribaculaceae bacterium]